MAGEIAARVAGPGGLPGASGRGPSAAGGGPLHPSTSTRGTSPAPSAIALDLPMRPGAFERFYLSAQVTLSPEPTLERLARLHGKAGRGAPPGSLRPGALRPPSTT